MYLQPLPRVSTETPVKPENRRDADGRRNRGNTGELKTGSRGHDISSVLSKDETPDSNSVLGSSDEQSTTLQNRALAGTGLCRQSSVSAVTDDSIDARVEQLEDRLEAVEETL